MQLLQFLHTMPKPERKAFALRCGTSFGHLQNIAYGYRPCGPTLAVAVERESGRQVTRQELRDDWHDLWPELAA